VSGDDCGGPVGCQVSAGIISTASGATEVEICIDDDDIDIVEAQVSGQSGPINRWIVTDTSLRILSIDTSNIFDFNAIEVGVCQIWHISFEPGLEGAAVDSSAADLSGCFALSNPITVTKVSGDQCDGFSGCQVSGGTISAGAGATEIEICIDDDEVDVLEAQLSGQNGPNSRWIVTDTALRILSIDTSNIFNFDSTGVGVCQIWHISFEDGLQGAEVDSNVTDLSGCFAVSNPITVTKLGGDQCPEECDVLGGTLTSDGQTDVTICGADADINSSINATIDGASGASSAWIITDTSGLILGFPLAPPFNFSGANPGLFQVWHLSYDGTISGASLGANASDITGCLAFSNPINVLRADVQSSTISFADSTTSATVCAGIGSSEALDVTVEGGLGDLQWIITDASGIILSLSESSPFSFEDAESGSFLIWAAHTAGVITALEVGSDIGDLNGCFALSNSLLVETMAPDGGSLSTQIGNESFEICVGDGSSDIPDLLLRGAAGQQMSYLVTDTSGLILLIADSQNNIDLENTSEDINVIWHLSYSGDIEGLELGSLASDLSGCFDLSNPVMVNSLRGDSCPAPCNLSGGTISLIDGGTEISLCVDDDLSDAFEVMVTGASGPNQEFIVTDDENNILGIQEQFRLNLEGTGPGVVFVRFITFEDDANIPDEGGSIGTLGGCFALSNIITVTRVVGDDCAVVCSAEGGVLSSDQGDNIEICSDDGEADIVEVSVSTQAGDSSVFVITDAASNILNISDLGAFDLEGTGSGSTLVWHLSYNGELTGLSIGANLSNLEGCFDLSNPITAIKSIGTDCPGVCITDGGSIMTVEGSDIFEGCAGDIFFTVQHVNDSDDTTATYYYVVTDEEGSILEWRDSAEGGEFDLSSATAGICRVYGYHATDSDLLFIGNNINNLEQGCGRLSDGSVTVIKDEGGECDEGCHVPRNIRFVSRGRGNSWQVFCDRVNDAESYIVTIGFEGAPNSFREVPLRRNRINVIGPDSRVLIVRVRAVCGFDEFSDFSRDVRLVDDEDNFRSSTSQTRSIPFNHGTVLSNGIVITEQSVAYPNPAVDVINLWYANEGTPGSISIFDLAGRRIVFQQIEGLTDIYTYDISSFNDGLYFILVESEGAILMQDKLVITKK